MSGKSIMRKLNYDRFILGKTDEHFVATYVGYSRVLGADTLQDMALRYV